MYTHIHIYVQIQTYIYMCVCIHTRQHMYVYCIYVSLVQTYVVGSHDKKVLSSTVVRCIRVHKVKEQGDPSIKDCWHRKLAVLRLVAIVNV